MIKVTIILPVFNTENYIKRCLDSILSQSYNYWDLIVVDDGSTDSSGIICDKYAQTDTRIKVIHKINEGASSARKLGIKSSKGEFLFFIDSDDYIDPNTLEELLSPLKESNQDIIIGNINIVRNNRIYCNEQQLISGNNKISLISSLLSILVISSLCGRLIRKNLFDDIVMLDQLKIGEDSIIMYQLFAKTEKVWLINNRLYYYVQHAESAMHSKSKDLVKSHIDYCKWVISFVEKSFPECEDALLRNSIAYFVINEYFAFLRDGGQPNFDPIFSSKVNNYYFNNKIAKSKMPRWRKGLLELYRINPIIGNIYRYIFVKLRYISDKHLR